MKKYKIVHRISADFIAEAIVNEDEIDTSINDLKEYKKPNSKFEYTMLKGTESVTQTDTINFHLCHYQLHQILEYR